MSDGGAIAIRGFRYQDYCAIYFALDSFRQSPTVFEHIYCEQGKVDFEIWNIKELNGYQAKTTQESLAAKDINSILKSFLETASKSRKNTNTFSFVLSEKPKHALNYLFSKLSGNSGVKNYNWRTEKYINDALKDITLKDCTIDHKSFNQAEIEGLAYSMSRDVLKGYLNDTDDIPTGVVINFIKCLRDEIDIISSEASPLKRIYKYENFDTLIKTYLSGIKTQSLKNRGRSKMAIRGKPIGLTPKVASGQKGKSSVTDSEEGKNLITNE